jgi:hypothetical protein
MRGLALAVVVAMVAAGCLAPASPPGPGTPGSGDGAAEWQQLCSISNWADACTVRASPNEATSKTEIDLAVNPTNPLNVIVGSKDLDATASDCVWAVAQTTKDGGRTWASHSLGGSMSERKADPTNPLFAWDCITDPIMVFDAQGTAYYALQAYRIGSQNAQCPQQVIPLPELPVPLPAPTGCGSSFYLATSTDGGDTWPLDRIVPMALGDANVVFHDYPRMVVSPATGSVSTVWNAIGPANVNPWVVTTRDQGASADKPVVVQAPDAPAGTAFASGFAALKDGTILMTVNTGGGSAGEQPVRLAVSTDDARTFGGFATILSVTPIECPLPNSAFRCGTSIELAADVGDGPRADRVYAIWDDGRNGNADIYSAWSDDKGATWSEPVRVNQDNTTHAQWMARATVSQDGAVHVLYMDRQWDPGDKLYDATHAWSTDGGATWKNQRLTNVSSDGDLGIHQSGFPFIGDYVGIGAVGGHLYVSFPQTVTGKAEIALSHLMRSNATAPAG